MRVMKSLVLVNWAYMEYGLDQCKWPMTIALWVLFLRRWLGCWSGGSPGLGLVSIVVTNTLLLLDFANSKAPDFFLYLGHARWRARILYYIMTIKMDLIRTKNRPYSYIARRLRRDILEVCIYSFIPYCVQRTVRIDMTTYTAVVLIRKRPKCNAVY